jgi:hypothetical protein
MSDLPPLSLVIDDLDITWNGGSYTSLELREPKIRELEAALGVMKNAGDDPSADIRFQIALIVAVSGKPKDVVSQMSVTQVRKAIDYLSGFYRPGVATT